MATAREEVKIVKTNEYGVSDYWILDDDTCNELTVNQSVLKLIRPSRLFAGFTDNTTYTHIPERDWKPISYPSNGISSYREHGFEIDKTLMRFTYIATTPKWIDITTTFTVKEVDDDVKNLTFRWFKNSIPDSIPHSINLKEQNESTITINTQIYMDTSDYIEPWVFNVNNSVGYKRAKILVSNMSVNFKADADLLWGCFDYEEGTNIQARRFSVPFGNRRVSIFKI